MRVLSVQEVVVWDRPNNGGGNVLEIPECRRRQLSQMVQNFVKGKEEDFGYASNFNGAECAAQSMMGCTRCLAATATASVTATATATASATAIATATATATPL